MTKRERRIKRIDRKKRNIEKAMRELALYGVRVADHYERLEQCREELRRLNK